MWKLYWVKSDGYEDCFVVAKNSRSAASIEIHTNGFESDDIKVTRIMDVPDKLEQIANTKFRRWSKVHAPEQAKNPNLKAWPYYARKWLLKKLGAKFRIIDGDEQVLLQDRVYGWKQSGEVYVYAVGIRALAERRNQWHLIEYNEKEYPDLETHLYSVMGIALSVCHEIEHYLSESFIFGITESQKRKYETINDLWEGWSKKTFGELIRLIQDGYNIEPIVKNGLELFRDMRNKLVHGITINERYNIHDEWGQKELLSFLDVFLTLANSIKQISFACYSASIQFGISLLEDEKKSTIKLPEDALEELSLFCESFEIKEELLE
jgi:hypothetical protein